MYLAILRTIDQSKIDIEGAAMVATATCGVCFNIAMYFILNTNRCFKDVGKVQHANSSSSQFTKTDVEMAVTVINADSNGKPEKENINMRAAAIHVIGDFIQSVGVLIAAVIIYCKVKNDFSNFVLKVRVRYFEISFLFSNYSPSIKLQIRYAHSYFQFW